MKYCTRCNFPFIKFSTGYNLENKNIILCEKCFEQSICARCGKNIYNEIHREHQGFYLCKECLNKARVELE